MLLLQEKEDVGDRKQPEVALAVSVNLESLASTSLISLPTTTSGKELYNNYNLFLESINK